MIKKFIDDNKDNILNNICELIKIPSISDESSAENGMPFGRNCSDALNYILNLADSLGFKTKNVDGYCGYIEFGEGKELLGIIGHLDVVPAGDGWTKCDPFEPVIEDNKLYGRGAIDDKGPVIASLYAMKYVMDTMNVNKRVRLILGLNEEVSWKCIEYYKQHEELPTFGFSPDADFPCIYAEKGFLNAFIESSYIPNGNIKIGDAQCQHPAADLSAQSKVPCCRLNDPHVQQIPYGEDCRGHLTDDSGNGCSHHAPPKSKNKDRVQNDIEYCPGKGRDHGKPRAAIRTDDGVHSLTEHVKRHAQCDVEEVFL